MRSYNSARINYRPETSASSDQYIIVACGSDASDRGNYESPVYGPACKAACDGYKRDMDRGGMMGASFKVVAALGIQATKSFYK